MQTETSKLNKAAPADAVSSKRYPAEEPRYQMSVPASQSPKPDARTGSSLYSLEYIPADKPQQATGFAADTLKKQLTSISEEAPSNSIYAPEDQPGHPEQPDKDRYHLPEDIETTPPHIPKPPKIHVPPPPPPSKGSYTGPNQLPEAFSPGLAPKAAEITTVQKPKVLLQPRNAAEDLPKPGLKKSIAQADAGAPQQQAVQSPEPVQNPIPKSANAQQKTILINFNNVGIIEFIRFISRISGKNFVFDEADLQFNVTIVSEEPTTIENIMTALLQELRIHDLTLLEQGNNLIIHKNLKVNSVSKVVAEDLPGSHAGNAEIVTQVFRMNTLAPDRAAAIIRPLVSSNALVEFIGDHLIVTDLHTNIVEIGKLLKSLDAPNSGLVIGQYVARTAEIDQLVPLVQQLMSPISKENPLVFVPYENSNSIFIVSSPFLVERSISILQHLDQEKGKTRIINLQELKFEGKGLGKAPVAPPAPPHPTAPGPSYTQMVKPESGGRATGWQYGPPGPEHFINAEQTHRETRCATTSSTTSASACACHPSPSRP